MDNWFINEDVTRERTCDPQLKLVTIQNEPTNTLPFHLLTGQTECSWSYRLFMY